MRITALKSKTQSTGSRAHQLGVTLIELLVALVIGLFLVAGILQVFVGSRQSLDIIRAQSSMQEAARFGLNFIASATRQAGYLNAGPIDATDLFASELVSKFQMVEYSDDLKPWVEEIWGEQAEFDALALISGEDNFGGDVGGITVAANTDVLRVRLQGDPDGLMSDCEGIALPADSTVYVNMSFFIGDDDQLYCRVFDGAANRAPVALVSGIENMQVQYGVATDPNQRFIVTQYVPGPDVTDWTQVMTVRVAILAVSDNQPLDRDQQQYDLLDEQDVTFSDGKARQVFTQTIALRGNLSNG
ncbi:MAG: PilW family protein [Gammaproteobacteria bacterium]|nr:PilW family protein [Gammaproteobacteria bacterium]